MTRVTITPASVKRVPVVIIMKEKVWESLAKDAGTFAMMFSLVMIGYLIGSNALQFFGGFMGIVWVLAKAASDGKKLSIEEARDKLDQIERETHHGMSE